MKFVLRKISLNQRWFLICRLCLVMWLLCKQRCNSWMQLLQSIHNRSNRWLMTESMLSMTSIDFWFLGSVFCNFLMLMVLVLFVICLQRGLLCIGLLSMLLYMTRALKLQLQLCFILSNSRGTVSVWNFHAKFAGMICTGNFQSVLRITPTGLMQG